MESPTINGCNLNKQMAIKQVDDFIEYLKSCKVPPGCTPDLAVLKSLNEMVKDIMIIKETWGKVIGPDFQDIDKKLSETINEISSNFLLSPQDAEKLKSLFCLSEMKDSTVNLQENKILVNHITVENNCIVKSEMDFMPLSDSKVRQEKLKTFLTSVPNPGAPKLESSPLEDYTHLLPLNDMKFIKALKIHTKYIEITDQKAPYYCVKCDEPLQNNYVVRHVRSNHHKKASGSKLAVFEEEFKPTQCSRIIVRIRQQEAQYIKEPLYAYKCCLCSDIMYTKNSVVSHVQFDSHTQKTISKCKPM